MKKSICLAVILCVLLSLLTIVMVGCGKTDPGVVDPDTDEPDGILVGGYSEDRELTEEDWAVFNKVMAVVVGGEDFEPTLVATQVVAGVNYRFTATAEAVVPGAEPYKVHIFIFQPLEGEPELVDIENIE